MYTIYIDDTLIYSPVMQDRKLRAAQTNLELNAFGGLTFSIGAENTARDAVGILSGTVTLFDDNVPIFKGRVLEAEKSFDDVLEVTCEGALGYFCDSVMRPFSYQGGVAPFVGMIIQNHNTQVNPDRQFKLGVITVTDPNDYITRSSIEYLPSWEVFKTRLLDLLGGYFFLRYEQNGIYVDYLEDFDTLNLQTIRFAENLLDFSDMIKGAEIATAIIPLGAKLEDESGSQLDERLTIADVNSGVDYVYSQTLVDLYGWIFKPVVHDNIRLPENLLAAGNDDLVNMGVLIQTMEVSAVDLSRIGLAIQSFRIGNYTRVISEPHGLNRMFLTRKVSLGLLDPAGGNLTLGASMTTISGLGAENKRYVDYIKDRVESAEKNIINTNVMLQNVQQNIYSSISQLAGEIISTVGESIVAQITDDLQVELSNINTVLTQTKESWTFQFNQFWQEFLENNDEIDSRFFDIQKYIRFEDGNIILGEVGNELQLVLQNNRISFVQSGVEVAYINNKKLYITDGEFLTSLNLGNFGFLPRANGNLSFKRVK